MKVKELFSKAVNFTDEHQREIKLGLTIAGIVLTGISAARAGIKADKILSEQKEKMDTLNEKYDADESIEDEVFASEKKSITIETIKRMVPVVLPPVIIGGATIYSAVSGYSSASKQIAALSAAYNISEKALSEYQEKAKEMLGDKKEMAIKDAVKQDHVKAAPPDKSKTIINTGNGTTLCMDDQSGRYFYSDPEAIRKAANTINKRMMDEYYISLNEFYDELGLPDITLGDDLGFNIDDGLIDVDHMFTAALHNDDTPILVVNYDVSPKFTEHRGKMFK